MTDDDLCNASHPETPEYRDPEVRSVNFGSEGPHYCREIGPHTEHRCCCNFTWPLDAQETQV